MFLLAHTGITLGAAWAVDHLGQGGLPPGNNAWARCFPLTVLGANLPDLIDKPVGLLVPELGLGTGRGIAHTLAFNLVLLFLALCFLLSGRPGLLYVALASLGHLVLDFMWQIPRVLFWPLFGFSFPKTRRRGFRSQFLAWWHTLWTDPRLYLAEAAGALFILACILQAHRA